MLSDVRKVPKSDMQKGPRFALEQSQASTESRCPLWGQRVTWIFIQGVAMCQTLLIPSPVTSPALVSLDQV